MKGGQLEEVKGGPLYDTGECGNAGPSPAGSSSGSAIAVSAGFASAALGTETSGSLIAPAGRAAAYSLRSTVGLVSRYGMIPGARTFDTIGPITKSAWDTALLLGCMAGFDPKDEASERQRTRIIAQSHTDTTLRLLLFCNVAKDAKVPNNKDYTQFTEMPHATFKGKRLGFACDSVFDIDIPWG